MKLFISPYGVMSRKQYWKTFLLLNGGWYLFVIIFALGLDLLENLFDLEKYNGVLSSIIAIFLIIMLIGSLIYLAIMSIFIYLRRGRDIGNDILWALIALLIPFGFIVLGIIPSKTNK